ncbi:MAG: RHS repeat-associated core domain-containing protein, partial [Chloroflexi bacterium]|nr:RHS repeat-associated core domain-containing protein [Chloroflexota bacterium]
DGPKSETLTYYDGEAYQGLTLGTMTKGLISSVSQKEEEGKEELIYSARSDYDEHGNIVEIIDSNGSIANTTSHRRQYTLDSLGLSVTRVEILLEDKEGEAYRLRQDVEYEEVFRKPSKSTSWMLVKGGTAVSDANPSKYRYDNQGRTVKIIRPGDTAAAPSMEYDYDLGDPSSRVVVNMRSAAGGAADLEEVRCFDGKGREFQRRTKLKSGLYQVNGFVTFNKRGAQVRQYQPYQGTTSACDTEPPNDVLYTSFRFDAAHRNIQTTDPDADIYGEASVSRTVYKPLTTLVYDAEDNLADSWAYNTPIVSRTDGLGRLLSIERYLGDMDSGGEAATVEVHYDTLGRISGFTDPMGHRHTQTLDLLGRTVAVDSPNTGTTTYKHDAMGNVLESTDARGETVVSVYDGMNRLVANYNAASPTDTRSEWTFDQAEDCSSCTNVVGKAARTTYPLGGDRGLGIDEAGFDAKGRLIYNARTLEGNKFETGLAYDNANRLTKTTFSDGNEFDYTYDAASRLNGIDGILHQIDFNEKGLLSEITFIEGTKNKRVYDSAMRLSSITSTSSSDTVLQGFEFTRNRLGAVLNLTDTSDAREGRPTFDANYAYDTWNRVIEASIDPGKSTAEVISLTYDVMDNLLSKTSSLGSSSRADVGDYSYDFADHPNAVSKAGDITFDYDASGNMTGRGDKDLTWDYQGRMTNVSSDNGSPGEFVYGPNHQRVMKLEEGGVTYYITPQFEVRDGIGTAYAKVGRTKVSRSQTSNLQTKIYGDIAPLDAADGLITAADAWVAHAVAEGIVEKSGLADGDGGRLLRAAARRLLLEEGDDLVFFHHDHLGSLTLATNGFAEVVGETAYYPSGEKRVSNGYIDEYGFTGQGLDASSGLTHFEYRYLDTGVGRWASADPAFHNVTGKTIRRLGESTTAYAYVSGNWTNVVDPLGLTEDGKGGGGNKTTDNGGGSSNKQSVPTSSRVRTARKNAVTSVKAGKKNVMNQVSKVKKTKAVKAATHWKKSATSGAFSVASGTVRVGVGIVTADVGGIFDGAISIGSGIVGVAGAAQDRSLNVNHGVSDLSGTEVTQSKLTKGLKYTGWALTAVGVGLTVAALTGVTLGAAPICVAAVSLAVAAFKLWSHRRDVKNSKGNLHGRQNSISQSESSASIASAQGSGVSFGYDYE